MTFTKTLTGWEITYDNGVSLGQLEAGNDGFYYWWPPAPMRAGYWNERVLRAIADKLADLNKEWLQEINDYFE